MRRVRDRIERVAATDFTVLIEGASGPQRHRGFIEVFGQAACYDCNGAVAGEEAYVSHTRRQTAAKHFFGGNPVWTP